MKLKDYKLLCTKDTCDIYDLGNGIILKRFKNIDKKTLDIYEQKVSLALSPLNKEKYQNIPNLNTPIDIYKEENNFQGYYQRKVEGTDFINYLRINKDFDPDTRFQKVCNYIIKKEEIIKPANSLGIYFPDGLSGNFLYNENNNIVNVNAIDYEGLQIENLTTLEFSDLIYNIHNRIIFTPKYVNKGLINYNTDIFSLGIEFLYFSTKINPLTKVRTLEDLKNYLDYLNFPNHELRKKLELLYQKDENNEYFKEALEDFKNTYTLTYNKDKQKVFKKR